MSNDKYSAVNLRKLNMKSVEELAAYYDTYIQNVIVENMFDIVVLTATRSIKSFASRYIQYSDSDILRIRAYSYANKEEIFLDKKSFYEGIISRLRELFPGTVISIVPIQEDHLSATLTVDWSA